MLGVELMLNFGKPYLTTNPASFWKQWHISLSTWLRDYLYIPLGGNRAGSAMMYRNLMITMVLGGIWHGAGWAFVFWGIYQGLLLVAHRLLTGRRPSPTSGLFYWLRGIVFFHLVCLGWLLFRCGSLLPEVDTLKFLSISGTSLLGFQLVQTEYGVVQTVVVMGMMTFGLQLNYQRFEEFHRWSSRYQVAWLTFFLASICLFGVFDGAQFIYFQF